MTECHLIFLEKSGNGFGARVAELPGCEVEAETREEALRLIREAIEVRTSQHEATNQEPPRPSFASL